MCVAKGATGTPFSLHISRMLDRQWEAESGTRVLGKVLWEGVQHITRLVRAGLVKKVLFESRLEGGRYRIPGTSDSKAQTPKPTSPLSQLRPESRAQEGAL